MALGQPLFILVYPVRCPVRQQAEKRMLSLTIVRVAAVVVVVVVVVRGHHSQVLIAPNIVLPIHFR